MINYNGHKKVIMGFMEHTCNIYEFSSIFDEITKQTNHSEILRYEKIPCKLSQSASVSGSNKPTSTEEYNKISHQVKLFLSNDIVVKAGSRVVVNYNNRVHIFENSSEPAVFSTHQEIILDRAKERS